MSKKLLLSNSWVAVFHIYVIYCNRLVQRVGRYEAVLDT